MIYFLFGVGCFVSFWFGTRFGWNFALEEVQRISNEIKNLEKE